MVDLFVRWTDAFVDYFFGRDNDDEVFLYVNKEILDEIGQKYDLGNSDDFLKVFLVDIGNRISLYDDLYLLENNYKPSRTPEDNRKLKSPSIFNFAAILGVELDQRPYYIPYIILAIYIASTIEDTNDKAVGSYLKSYLKDYFKKARQGNDYSNENGRYEDLEDLFEWLHEEYPMFNNKLRGNHRYIGLLKYQLLLSQSEINEINKALYIIQYNGEDANLSYLDKVRLLKDYVNEKVKTILVDSLDNVDYQYRINRIIDNFDLETHQEKNPNANRIKLHFGFVHMLWFDENSNKRGFKILTNLRDLSVKTNDYRIQKSANTIGGYNAEFVNYKGSDSVLLEEITKLNSEDFDITPMPLDDVVFFYKYNDEYYIQSRESLKQEVYIFVKRKDKFINNWEKWAANDHVLDMQKIEDEDVEDLTHNKWTMYLAQGILAPYYDSYKEEGKTYKNKVRTITRKESILPPGKINTYLINALPYFEFPEVIDTNKLDVYINMDDDPQNEGNDFRLIICANRLIIDICKDVDLTESRRIDLKIEYDNELNAYEYFYVCGQNINYEEPNLFMINNWGEKIDEPSEKYIQGNNVMGITQNMMGREQTKLSEEDLDDDTHLDSNEFYFINLLAACIYMEPNSTITRNRLEKCIRYAATRLDIDTKEPGLSTKVVNLLVNSGYISADFQTRHYQAIPPTFLRFPLHVSNIKRDTVDFSGKVYLLTGLITKKFYADLCNYCNKHKLQIRYRYSDRIRESRSYLRLLPPIILIDNRFSVEDFCNEYPIHKVNQYDKLDLSKDILSLTPSISEYSSTLTAIPKDSFNVELVDPTETSFPRIREDNPFAYNNHVFIEKAEGVFMRPNIREYAWANIYCYYKRNEPFIIRDNGHIYFPTELHLPSLIQRALFISNIGVASYKKAFICDNPFDDNVLYTKVKSYRMTKSRQIRIIEILTGSNDSFDKNTMLRKVAKSTSKDRILDKWRWHYEMELWTRKERINNKNSKHILVLKNYEINYKNEESERVFAFAEYNDIYVKTDDNTFRKAIGSVNKIMSILIKKYEWKKGEDIEIEDNISSQLPSQDLYNIEKILIL